MCKKCKGQYTEKVLFFCLFSDFSAVLEVVVHPTAGGRAEVARLRHVVAAAAAAVKARVVAVVAAPATRVAVAALGLDLAIDIHLYELAAPVTVAGFRLHRG
jgi:hypothetical protein